MDVLRLFCTVATLFGLGSAWSIESRGFFTLNDAAFASLLHGKSPSGGYDLVISSFNAVPGTKDIAVVVRDVGSQLLSGDAGNFDIQTLADGLLWPNEIEEVPEDVFGHSDLWWVACGFLVPTKTDGYLGFIENSHDTSASPAPWYRVTETTEENSANTPWFYHHIAFIDVDGDGLKDMVSSRANVPTIGDTTAEMFWFKQPRSNPLATIWTETFMFSGPDSMFRYEEIPLDNGKTRFMFLSTQYFSEKLVLSWADGNSFSQATGGGYLLNHVVVDSTAGERYFDSEIVDLNGDGVLDFLVTANSDVNGKLLAYEVPWDDPFYGSYVKHVLAEGFAPHGIVTGEGNGSPGLAFSIMPSTSESRYKPIIIMTGDDDQNVYIFESTTESPNDWSYIKTSIFQANRGTVGAPAAKDVDGDGNIEIFIPAWTDGEVHVLTYVP